MNPAFWSGKRVFVTWHAGFKGSWLCLCLQSLGAKHTGYALATPTQLKANCPVSRLDLLTYLEQNRVGTRLLFAGNLTRQPYMQGQAYRISGDLRQTDTVMKHKFWIGVQPALTPEMLEFAAKKIESYLGVAF